LRNVIGCVSIGFDAETKFIVCSACVFTEG
jgi:hypothetical protein